MRVLTFRRDLEVSYAHISVMNTSGLYELVAADQYIYFGLRNSMRKVQVTVISIVPASDVLSSWTPLLIHDMRLFQPNT